MRAPLQDQDVQIGPEPADLRCSRHPRRIATNHNQALS